MVAFYPQSHLIDATGLTGLWFSPQGHLILVEEAPPTGATVKVYDGATWNTHPLKVYDGAAFVQAKEVVTF